MDEKEDLECDVLTKFYQAHVPVLRSILNVNKIMENSENTDNTKAIRTILTWLDKAESTMDGNSTIPLILSDALSREQKTIKIDTEVEKLETVD
jgi:hypothetical protein